MDAKELFDFVEDENNSDWSVVVKPSMLILEKEASTIVASLFGEVTKEGGIRLGHVAHLIEFVESAYVVVDWMEKVFEAFRFRFVRAEKLAIISVDGLNILNILVHPQAVRAMDDETWNNILATRKEVDKKKIPFLYGNLKVKTVEFGSSGAQYSTVTKFDKLRRKTEDFASFVKENWFSIQDSCYLPFMNFAQPLGFELIKKKNEALCVYIHLTMLPPANQRRLSSNEEKIQMSGDGSIVANMIKENALQNCGGLTVDSSPIMVHPFNFTEDRLDRDHYNMEDPNDVDLFLENPLTDCLTKETSSRTSGEHYKVNEEGKSNDVNVSDIGEQRRRYSCRALPPALLLTYITTICGVSALEDIFTHLPTEEDITEMGEQFYATILYINFKDYLYEKYNSFSSLSSYVHFALDLLFIVKQKLPNLPLAAESMKRGNALFLGRLLFRYLAPTLGIMIPEGNGRNFSSCIVHSRRKKYNHIQHFQLAMSKQVPMPDFRYLHSSIVCEYIVKPAPRDIRLGFRSYPNTILEKFWLLSKDAYTRSQSSVPNFCIQFADTYLLNNKTLLLGNLAYGMRSDWSKEIRANLLYISAKRDEEKTKKARVLNPFSEHLLTQWLSHQKKTYFDALAGNRDILQIVLPEQRRFLATSNQKDNFTDLRPVYIEMLKEKYQKNEISEIYDFNLPVTMSLMLCGLVCPTRDVFNNDSFNQLRQLVSCNGLVPKKQHKENVYALELETEEGLKFPIRNDVSFPCFATPTSSVRRNHRIDPMVSILFKCKFLLFIL